MGRDGFRRQPGEFPEELRGGEGAGAHVWESGGGW